MYLPVMDLEPLPIDKEEGCALFNRVHSVIFTSQAAVRFAAPVIQAHPQRWPTLCYIAIGPSTAQALQDQGISKVLIPQTPPYETESLIALEHLQKIQGHAIAIVKGIGGRTLLAETLEARGAKVHPWVVYQRKLSILDPEALLDTWTHTPPDLSVSTSASALEHLLTLLGPKAETLKTKPIIVVGARMLALAQKFGFQKPLLATGADDSTIIEIVRAYEDRYT